MLENRGEADSIMDDDGGSLAASPPTTDSEESDRAGWESPTDGWESAVETDDQPAHPQANDTQEHAACLSSSSFDFPLHPGSDMTLRMFLATTVTWVSDNKISMTALEDLLKLQARMLPADNLVPESLYKFLDLLDINPREHEHHVCVNDCELFPDLKQADYAEHVDDQCAHCHERRFSQHGRAIVPRKKFYHLPLAPQLQLLWTQGVAIESMKKMEAEIRGGLSCEDSFWAAKLTETVRSQPDFLDHFRTELVVSVGLDGVQCFKKENYQVWPIAIKLWNLHPNERTSKDFVLLTTLIPGRDTPSNFAPYLKLTLEEIKGSDTRESLISS